MGKWFIKQKKGQVTIFIILGMMMLAAAAFMFFLVSSVQKESLITERDNAVGNLFEKESLRLFVDDCLEDSLEEGLLLIGEQGRLWDGQSGGTLTYLNGINGMIHDESRVFLGVTYDENEVSPNIYPCSDSSVEGPDFCQYGSSSEGDGEVSFGSKASITKTSVEEDLERYMLEEVVKCAESFLFSELSYAGDLIVGDVSLSVELVKEGFDLSVSYPFELTVGGENYFHLEEFDFFYISDFDSFFGKAVTNPLKDEARDINYGFTEEELLESPTYRDMPISYTKTEDGDGNWVVSYLVDEGVVLRNFPFEYNVAVKNRPPALDYISRNSCVDYDYLVIKGYQTEEKGGISMFPNALDPDDDTVSYSIDSDSLDPYVSEVVLEETGISGLEVSYSDLAAYDPVPGTYYAYFYAEDSHGLIDWQEVRVLIDSEMTVTSSVRNPYDYDTSSGKTVVSIEDPTFVTVAVGGESVSLDATEYAYLSYTDGIGVEEWSGAEFDISAEREHCFSFPWPSGRECSTASYASEILDWKEKQLETEAPYSSFYSVSSLGELTLDFSRNYCGSYEDLAGDSEQISVVECIPHESSTNPFAYPYHGYSFDDYEAYLDGNGEFLGEDNTVDPFFATHSCCDPGTHAPYTVEANEDCFTSPAGCYGKAEDYIDGSSGLVLEEAYDVCTGLRGNVCGDGDSPSYRLSGGMVCGKEGDLECDLDDIPDLCEGENAWGFVKDDNGVDVWCHGKMGCSEVSYASDGPVVYVGSGSPTTNGVNGINSMAMNANAVKDLDDDPNFQFRIGCEELDYSLDEEYECDANYDGDFEGTCSLEDEGYVCS